jgi:hypothetical protein
MDLREQRGKAKRFRYTLPLRSRQRDFAKLLRAWRLARALGWPWSEVRGNIVCVKYPELSESTEKAIFRAKKGHIRGWRAYALRGAVADDSRIVAEKIGHRTERCLEIPSWKLSWLAREVAAVVLLDECRTTDGRRFRRVGKDWEEIR